MEAHIDDVCLGANTQEDHLILLGEFFAVCQEDHTRLKLENYVFLQETMQYLGFDIGYGWWTPAASKVKLLMDANEAVPRTPWPGYGIQPVSGPLTPLTAVFRAVKPRIGNRCTASGDLCIRISGINRVLFSYCFRQFLRFRSDTHCFDCWRLARDFTVTASLTVYNGNFNAIRHEGSKVARNCMDASAIFIINTSNLNPNFSGCRNRIFDFDIPALDLTSFEWTYVLLYARINFPFILPSICLKDMGKTKLIREATCEGHISCCLRGITIRKRGMYSQYS